MKPYEHMKPSTYEWLHTIPSHWQELFLEQVSREKCEKNIGNQESNVLSLSYGRIIRKKNVYAGLVAKDFATYQIVRRNDIILRFTDLQNDHTSLRTGLVTETGIITAAYTCIVPTINSAFLRYLLHAYDLRKVFYGMGGGVRQSIGFKNVRHMFVPVPPRAEQDQIVRFLDWKVSDINKLIVSKRKQISFIQEYRTTMINNAVTQGVRNSRLKPSGMNWLPQIPANWETIPAKALFDHIVELRHEQDEMLAATQKYGMIAQKEYMALEGRRIVLANDNLDKWLHVEPDDFIISLRSFQGGLEVCTMPGCVTWHYVVLRPKENVCVPYFKWLFKSASYIGALQRTSDFIRDGQDLRFSNFIKVRLLLVPLDEQREIAEYLDKKIPLFDVAEKKISDEIAALQEIKARLISDVVTGKIDVRGIEIPEYEPVTEESEPADEDSTEEEPAEDQED